MNIQKFDHAINIIETAWENKQDLLNLSNLDEIKSTVDEVISLIDRGTIRVSTKEKDLWQCHQWIKKAILLSFKLNDNRLISGNAHELDNSDGYYYDKIGMKYSHWQEQEFKDAGFRAVPGSIARFGSYIGKNVVLMPSFINIGAYVDDGTMVDTWVTIGSCAQIGKNCHISGGVGIGGVLEPLQANPVIIEDNCFIGARSEVAEGVIVEEGSVISMGVFLGASTKIIDRETGEIFYGRVPAYSVVVPGSVSGASGVNLYAAIIVKRVDEKTRSKTSINELLRA